MFCRRLVLAAALLEMAAARAQGQHRGSPLSAPRDTSSAHKASARLYVWLAVDADGRAQDRASLQQLGDLPELGRIRFARAHVEGKFFLGRPWTYHVAIDASGLYADNSPVLTVKDLALAIPVGGRSSFTVGRQKEGFGEDILPQSISLPFAERAAAVTVFAPARNDGFKLKGPWPRATGGWELGFFDNWIFNKAPFRLNGPQGVSRVFWAPIFSPDSNRALHFGFAARWTGSSNGGLAFRTRPEQQAAPYFVNTGMLSSSSALTLDGEFVALRDGWSLTAEVLPTQTYGTWDGTLRFISYYAALSWRPQRVARRYDPELGALGGVRTRPHGSVWELGVRFSHTDVDDQVAQGGVLDIPRFSFGLWGPSQTRVLFDYGFTSLRKSGHVGHAQLLTLRFQWTPDVIHSR